MADFSDNFTEASAVLLKNHSPDTGTSWTWSGTNDDGWAIDATNDETVEKGGFPASTTPGTGYSYISPAISSANKVVWGQFSSTLASSVTVLAGRLTDGSNYVGLRMSGTGSQGLRLVDEDAGTYDDTWIRTQGAADEWYRLKLDGTTVSLWKATGSEPTDPEADTNWTQVGTDQTISTVSTETQTGYTKDSDGLFVNVWSSFRASALGAGGGATTFKPPSGLSLLGVGV